MLDSDVFDFIERSREYKAAADLLHDLRKTIRHFGFENFILSGVPVGGQKLAPMVELMGWPAGWFERYAGARYAEVDGVCLYSARTHSPFYWSDVPRVRISQKPDRGSANSRTVVSLMSGQFGGDGPRVPCCVHG